MQFGGIGKYTGRNETSRTIGFTKEDQESLMHRRTGSLGVGGEDVFRNTQARISEALRS